MKKRKIQRINRRIDVAPAGGAVAQLGLYTAEVQEVVANWQHRIPADVLEHYFVTVALPLVHRDYLSLPLPRIPKRHWGFLFQVGGALVNVLEAESKPESWLIRMNHTGEDQGHGIEWEKWPSVAWSIKESGGPAFKPTRLAKAAERLRLLTPTKLANDYLRTRAGR